LLKIIVFIAVFLRLFRSDSGDRPEKSQRLQILGWFLFYQKISKNRAFFLTALSFAEVLGIIRHLTKKYQKWRFK